MKLSEISMDTYISVGDIDVGLMTKEDYLQSSSFLNGEIEDLYEAEPLVQTFNWADVIEYLGQEQHSDWCEIVMNDINGDPVLEKAAEILNAVFSRNVTYYEGAPIENDLVVNYRSCRMCGGTWERAEPVWAKENLCGECACGKEV